jgi:hypothetical protein
MATSFCKECDEITEHDLDPEEFRAAIIALNRRRFVDLLDELERALPSEFVGLADDVIKWAGKSR